MRSLRALLPALLCAFWVTAAAAAPAPFDAQLSDAHIAPAVAALRELLPDDYAGLIARLTEAQRQRPDPRAVVPQSEAYLTDVLTRRRQDMAAAPASALVEAARAETAFGRALRDQGLEVCVARSRDEDVSQRLREPAQKLANQAYVAKLKAIRAGKDMPTSRPEPSDADLAPWFNAQVELYGRERTLLAVDPEWLKTASPQDLCETSVEPLNAMVALQPEQTARVFLKLMDGPATGFAGMRRAPAAR